MNFLDLDQRYLFFDILHYTPKWNKHAQLHVLIVLTAFIYFYVCRNL